LRALGLSQSAIADELTIAQSTVGFDVAHLPDTLGSERDAIAADAQRRLVA